MTFVIVAGLIVGGVGVTLLLCRLAKVGRFLTIAVLVSYGLRVGLAIGLYLISAYQFPVFQGLQLGDGFWRFARDAPGYHWNAAQIAEAFRRGTEIPPLMVAGQHFPVDPDFYLLIASVYRLLGAHPLYIPLLNATLWSGISISAYLLARRMKGEEAARLAGLLVSFWPSPYIWSSQILKDTVVVFLVISGLSLCVLILRQRAPLWLAAIVPLVPVSFLLARLRFYALLIVVLAVGIEVVASLVRSSPHRQWGTAVRGLVLMGVLLTISVGARSVDYDVLLSRADPDMSRLRKAEYLLAQGDHAAATGEYQHALALHQRLAEARLRIRKESPPPEAKPAAVSPPESKPSPGPPPEAKPSEPPFSPAQISTDNLRKAEHLWAQAAKEQQGAPAVIPQASVEVSKGLRGLFQMFSLNQLTSVRHGYGGAGGASNVGADIEINGFWDMVAYVPRAFANALFAPFPWDWFSTKGDTGVFKLLSGIEVMLLIALTPFLLVGVVRAARSGFKEDTWLLLGFVAVAAVLLGLTITNIGILFRLRLQFLIPLFVVLAAYGADNLRRAVDRLLPRRLLRRPGQSTLQGLSREGP